jgi:hypothetical protein
MQSCKMVYPMHACALSIGVPERPDEDKSRLRSRKKKTSATCVCTLQRWLRINYLHAEPKYAVRGAQVPRCTDVQEWMGIR